jgi:hypothetical protein
MAEYVTRIRTENGDMQIDYKSLANLPSSDTTLLNSGEFADAKVVGVKIQEINKAMDDHVQYMNTTIDTHMSKVASDTDDGHMTSADKVKLDGIEDNANNYSLPIASNLVLGGVTTTSDVESSDGLIACPIVNGVPYYHDNTLEDFGVNATSQELNLLSGLSTISEKPKMETITLTASGWVDNEQFVVAKYVTENNLVMISPEPSSENYNEYFESNVRCVSQSDGSLTFNREYESKLDILVNVVVFMD